MKVTSIIKTLILFIFTSLLHLSPIYAAEDERDVWAVLRNLLSVNHEVTQPAVQAQIRWLTSHPEYLQNVSRKSEPYIYHIVTEIKRRGLPGELALIPMVESSWDPFAYSHAGAAGLWQIMPETANDLDLKRNWWYDGRRSITPSTDAALNYLLYLNKFFDGNWVLAFAAYNAGEGTIARSIKSKTKKGAKPDFWKLSIPRETKAYVPRLLALAEIVKHPERYKVKLPAIPYLPYFKEVHVGTQIDLSHAAKLAGISYGELIKLNPGFNRWATDPGQPHKLLIPKEKVANFHRNLAKLPQKERISFIKYQVKKRDSIKRIAAKYHTTIELLKKLNGLKSNTLKPGISLLIPRGKPLMSVNKPKPSAMAPSVMNLLKKKRVIHIVQSNETLNTLEKQYGVLASEIRVWNKLNKARKLEKGQQLVIWKTLQDISSKALG